LSYIEKAAMRIIVLLLISKLNINTSDFRYIKERKRLRRTEEIKLFHNKKGGRARLFGIHFKGNSKKLSGILPQNLSFFLTPVTVNSLVKKYFFFCLFKSHCICDEFENNIYLGYTPVET